METPDVYGERESYDDIWDDFSQSNYRAQQHLKNRIFTDSSYFSKVNLNSLSIPSLKLVVDLALYPKNPSRMVVLRV